MLDYFRGHHNTVQAMYPTLAINIWPWHESKLHEAKRRYKIGPSPLFLGPQILPIMNMQPRPHRDHHFKEIVTSQGK
jgi:hypothetical protein